MTPRAMIVGSGGQDGSLMHDLLLKKGYEVIGLTRGGVISSTGAWDAPPVDIVNSHAVSNLIARTRPDEIYFLAAHHHSSQDNQGDDDRLFRSSTDIHLIALVAFLEAMRHQTPRARLFYAASSHIFGSPSEQPQDESTAISPETIYGITKAAGLFACRRYRKTHGLFASVGILYNHESHLRGAEFVSKKIAVGVAAIMRGSLEKIVLGDLAASTDWGYAPDYVEAMHRMLQLDVADDFILATGKAHTVDDFVTAAFGYAGLNYRPHIEIDTTLVRRRMPGLVGDPAKFKAASGWTASVDFSEMVRRLVQRELEELDGE